MADTSPAHQAIGSREGSASQETSRHARASESEVVVAAETAGVVKKTSTKSLDPAPASPSSSAARDRLTSTASHQQSSSAHRGPSIGTIKVLGHRGCDTNTQGWFLSVGTPEQYDFSVSEDGETVVVEPNVPEPTGNFEFVHCADPRELVGKRVRFTAEVKAQAVTQTARLRLRGEDFRIRQNLKAEEPLVGTYDWKETSVEADVGPGVALFSYGVTFRSVGKLWIRNPTLTVLDR